MPARPLALSRAGYGRLLAGLAVGALAAAAARAWRLGPAAGLALLAAGLAALFLLARWPGGAGAGPLFYYDLVRLARRGRSTLLRCAYGLALLGALFLFFNQRFPYRGLADLALSSERRLSVQEMSRFAEGFVFAVFVLQSAAVFVLTPAYLAGAIAEEKERRTLELLFTTHLLDREIVLGKLCSRLTHLAGVLLTGLPVLSLVQLWGGVDFATVLGAFAVTALNLLSVGSLSILCSVLCRTVMAALLIVYAALVCLSPVVYLGSPVGFVSLLNEEVSRRSTPVPAAVAMGRGGVLWPAVTPAPPPPPSTGAVAAALVAGYALIHGAAAAVCAALAVASLRAGQLPEGPRPDPTPAPAPAPQPVGPGRGVRVERLPGWGPVTTDLPPAPVKRYPAPYLDPPAAAAYVPWRRPPVGDNALLWRELHRGAAHPLTDDADKAMAGLWPLMLGVVLGAFLAWAFRPGGPGPEGLTEPTSAAGVNAVLTHLVTPLLRVTGLLLALAWCAATAFRAATSLSREREQGTLDGLLTLPVSRRALLGAKWLGSVLRYRLAGYALAGVLTVGLLSGALHPLSAAALAAGYLAFVAFVASLGVWLSLACRNTLWAQVTTALMLLVLFAGAWVLLLNYAEPFGGQIPGRVENMLQYGLSPLGAWWHLAFSWVDYAAAPEAGLPSLRARLGSGAAGVAVFAALAGLLWLAGCARFNLDPRR
jgi:ABC-type transport system involved in multi-copper enzyme maturation permease subunit